MASDREQHRIERLLDQIEEAADKREWDLVTELAKHILAFVPVGEGGGFGIGRRVQRGH